ncbi:MAG: hypothetical protein M1826_006870 [Phylliscum demangeonii]|nr:MAG: hypothetical protein M1826_006870 [Phylliscum demangeonii]
MVKSYLKYDFARTFGLVHSASANVIWIPDARTPAASARHTGGGRAIVAANEEILCWDIKKGELSSRWRDEKCRALVTCIAQSKTEVDVFAVGYEDGSIRLWDATISAVIVSFNGHRSAVTTLAFDESGVRLASGSKDTDIIVWDLVAEVGLFKLRGHRDQITGLHFLRQDVSRDPTSDGMATTEYQNAGIHDGFLLTTGKDSLIKIWDLGVQHCTETRVVQANGECWALGVSPDHSGCITAGNDGELRLWSLDLAALHDGARRATKPTDRRALVERGTLYRQGKDRTLGIHFHPQENYFAVHGSEKAVEIWRMRSAHEIQKSLARKRKRKREKEAAETEKGKEPSRAEADGATDESTTDVADVFILHVIVRTSGRVASIDWARSHSTRTLQLLVAMTNNQLDLYSIGAREEKKKSKLEDIAEYDRAYAVEIPGHRTDIRSLSLSSDDKMLASASNGSLKAWNVRTGSCLRTFECSYVLCCSFLPGDRIIVTGNKNGELDLYDVASSALVSTTKAHEGAIWDLQIHPDGKSIASASADKSVKFWKFDILQEEISGTTRTAPRLQLTHTRTLKVSDDVLSLKFSPDCRLLALALLDNTVKVFFVDSLKLYLNLYGHKLPVLNLDISFDSKLIVTCSADKNIRLWGLDFGDCHKALFGHQDSIMRVAFVPHNHDGNGHHFFSASKDRLVKYWDGDKFEQIQKLDGHHGEIWALVVSGTGQFVVTASHDKSIRVWEETEEQVFLEEERERELEALYETTLATSLEHGAGDDADDAGPTQEAGAVGKQTVETLMTGERIVEALELGMADRELMRAWRAAKGRQATLAPPARHPLFTAFGDIGAEDHVLGVLQKVKAAALADALLILPFSLIPALFTFLDVFASTERSIPLTCRILFFMLQTHHRQIVASKTLRPMLDGVRAHLRRALQRQKDEMGFNLAALRVVDERVREKGVRYFEDAEDAAADKGRTKRAFVDVG